MQIEADARLAAAAGGAARYFADVAGLAEPAIAHWQAAVVAACKEAFGHLTKEHPWLEVTLTRLADRIEVALAREGETAPAVGMDSLAGLRSGETAEGRKGSPVLGGVDGVRYETRGGMAVTLLTKYITPGTPTY